MGKRVKAGSEIVTKTPKASRRAGSASTGTDPLPRIGVHVSVTGGLENAFVNGAAAGCDVVQVFVKNQRQWWAKPLSDEQIRVFHDARPRSNIIPVTAHASYLLNLAAPNDAIRTMSVDAMIDELTRCEALDISGLVFHPGAHCEPECRMTNGEDRMTEADLRGIERIAHGIDEVHNRCAGFKTMLLLECTAGQGSAIGWQFEQLAEILKRVRNASRIGVCLDTCHLFAAGYDFRKPEGYAAIIEHLDATVGIPNVKCIHCNDSKRELGSRVDRHEHIGKGMIGKSGFANFLNDPRFRAVPYILETPKGEDEKGRDLDRLNVQRLRRLVR